MMMSVAWMTLHWRELDIEYVVSELSDLLKKIYPWGWQERREVFKGGVGKACHVNQCGVAPRGIFPRARSKEQKYWSRRWPINPSHPVTNVSHPLAKRAGESFALSYTQRRHSPSAPQRHCKFSVMVIGNVIGIFTMACVWCPGYRCCDDNFLFCFVICCSVIINKRASGSLTPKWNMRISFNIKNALRFFISA